MVIVVLAALAVSLAVVYLATGLFVVFFAGVMALSGAVCVGVVRLCERLDGGRRG